jgi:hypothetical protein
MSLLESGESPAFGDELPDPRPDGVQVEVVPRLQVDDEHLSGDDAGDDVGKEPDGGRI